MQNPWGKELSSETQFKPSGKQMKLITPKSFKLFLQEVAL